MRNAQRATRNAQRATRNAQRAKRSRPQNRARPNKYTKLPREVKAEIAIGQGNRALTAEDF